MTKAQRYSLGQFFARNSGVDGIGELLAAWDAAPADPVEAVTKAIYDNDGWAVQVDAVLAALGWSAS
jgi:hypothetical protein